MGSATVLVVEDNRLNMKLVRDVLEFAGYTVLEAVTGEEGVEMADASHPDLILMDVVMPRMTGFEALRELRGRESTRDIPIIMVTTRGEGPNVETGYQSGCTDYVTKPIDPVLLMGKVRTHLGEPEPPQ